VRKRSYFDLTSTLSLRLTLPLEDSTLISHLSLSLSLHLTVPIPGRTLRCRSYHDLLEVEKHIEPTSRQNDQSKSELSSRYLNLVGHVDHEIPFSFLLPLPSRALLIHRYGQSRRMKRPRTRRNRKCRLHNSVFRRVSPIGASVPVTWYSVPQASGD
jgi:hypothetical protein